jgi:hypothetical protein
MTMHVPSAPSLPTGDDGQDLRRLGEILRARAEQVLELTVERTAGSGQVVDALKIDRSFISGLRNNQEGETLLHTLVQLGKALSIKTFAEGIEQQHELSLLRHEDCDSGQGFLFARPLDVAATEVFLRSWAGNADTALAQAPQSP